MRGKCAVDDSVPAEDELWIWRGCLTSAVTSTLGTPSAPTKAMPHSVDTAANRYDGRSVRYFSAASNREHPAPIQAGVQRSRCSAAIVDLPRGAGQWRQLRRARGRAPVATLSRRPPDSDLMDAGQLSRRRGIVTTRDSPERAGPRADSSVLGLNLAPCQRRELCRRAMAMARRMEPAADCATDARR